MIFFEHKTEQEAIEHEQALYEAGKECIRIETLVIEVWNGQAC